MIQHRVLGLLVLCACVGASGTTVAENAAAEHRSKRAAQESCRDDVNCYSEKGKFYALSLCKEAIERAAPYGLKWTDGLFETPFSDVAWKDKETGIVEFRGDRAAMQNQYGAWQTASYTCAINVPAGSMVDFSVKPKG